MLTQKTWVVALAAAATAVLSGCGGGRHESTEYYALVATSTKIPYWADAAAGLTAAAKELGVRAEVSGPEGYDPKGEKDYFQQIVAHKPAPAGILVSAADAEVMREPIDAAVAAGIPVVTIDSDSPKSKRLMFIGTNNYDAGQIGGGLLSKQLKGKGTAVVYTNAGQPNLEERLEGYKRALTRDAGIKIDRVIDIKGEPSNAFDATQAITQKGGTLPDAFVCLEALSCAEVADVLQRGNVTGKTIIAMDAGPSTLQWIQKGVIQATIAQRPYTMAYYGLRVLDDLHHNKTVAGPNGQPTLPVFIDTGTVLVDSSNVGTFASAATPGK
jgi:ribose transport system substrate-binding protein